MDTDPLRSSNFFFLKTQTMRWTPHMEECMQKLADEPQWPGDLVLVVLAKVYKVLEDYSQIQWANSEFGGRAAATSAKTNPIHYLKSLRANLEEIKKSLTPELLENSMFPFSPHPSVFPSLSPSMNPTP